MKMTSLHLQNALLNYDQLSYPPSRQDGILDYQEDALRDLGCELIQSAGILLRLPQVAMATACVLFQRFFYVASLRRFGVREIGMGALFLAAKIEECSVRIHNLLSVFDYLTKRLRGEKFEPLDGFSQAAYDLKRDLLAAEMQILNRLGFNVRVELPYGLCVNYLRVMGLHEREVLAQRAWSFLNDGLRTNVYVTYHPPILACAAIHLACRFDKVKLPHGWCELFDAEWEDVQSTAGQIMWVYERAKRLENGEKAKIPLEPEEIDRWLKEMGEKVEAEQEDGEKNEHQEAADVSIIDDS